MLEYDYDEIVIFDLYGPQNNYIDIVLSKLYGLDRYSGDALYNMFL